MLKRVVLGLSDRIGINAAVRRATIAKRSLLTLCYHSVLPAAEVGTSHIYRNTVSIEDLREQLQTLAAWFEFASPDAVLMAAEGQPLRRPSVLLTFDDGHESLLRHAAPLLERMGIPALFCITTGHIGTDRPLWTEELCWLLSGWPATEQVPLPLAKRDLQQVQPQSRKAPKSAGERSALMQSISRAAKALTSSDRGAYLDQLRELSQALPPSHERTAFRFLDWDGVRELHRRGFAVGSHTVQHSILSRDSIACIDRELIDSKQQLEHQLEAECPWIAYPNGGSADVSEQVFDRARAAGYRAGFTTIGGFDEPTRAPLAIGRASVPGRLSRSAFRAMASGVHDWLPRRRPHPGAPAVRQAEAAR